MKKLNKKGFTIVELVIVIAVIAILAGVLIPTFATVVDKANESKAMQEAKNEYEAYLAEYAKDLDGKQNLDVVVDGKYYFEVRKGEFNTTAKKVESNPFDGKADQSKVYSKPTGAYASDGEYYTKSGATYTKVPTNTNSQVDFDAGKYYVLATNAADLGSTTVAIYVATP